MHVYTFPTLHITLKHRYFHPSILCSPLTSANHCAAHSTASSTSISGVLTNIYCVWSCTNWTATENTETQRNRTCLPRTWTQDKEVQWRWCWQCGGGSECQLRSGRRTKCQLDSPHTLLLCSRQRWRTGGWTFLCYCARRNNGHPSRSDSRTDYSFQTHSRHYLLSFCFLCNWLIYQPFRSTRPPSNSDQSDCFHTAAEASGQICLDDLDTTDPRPRVSSSCCRRTVWSDCLLCLCRVLVRRNLVEIWIHNTAAVITRSSPHLSTEMWSETHLHFRRPGLNHRTPRGSTLKTKTLHRYHTEFVTLYLQVHMYHNSVEFLTFAELQQPITHTNSWQINISIILMIIMSRLCGRGPQLPL